VSLLGENKVYRNYVMFAPEYEPETLKDELDDDFQCCVPPNISIELTHDRYSGSLHKPLNLNTFEFVIRTT
jgi:hypothetical protein